MGKVAAILREVIPGVDVYEHEAFLGNNQREMESVFLPLLWMIAAIGAVVLGALLSVLMSIHVLERRKDFAVLKTLGAPVGYLPRLLLVQVIMIVSAGCGVGVALFVPLSVMVPLMTPELTPVWTVRELAIVVFSAHAVGIASSAIPMAGLRRIYALEAFQ